MATTNSFDLLGGADVEDLSQFVAASLPKAEKLKKAPASAPSTKPAQLPTKPAPPTQAVRENRNESGRGGGRGGGRGFGRGRGNRDREFNRDSNAVDESIGFSGGYKPSEEGERRPYERRGGYDGPRGGFRGGRRGGFSNGESGEGEGERPRRVYDRHSSTGYRGGMKREGSGPRNWGSPSDDVAQVTEETIVESEKIVDAEKQSGEEGNVDAGKDNAVAEPKEVVPEEDKVQVPEEDKEMTLEEYEKMREDQRKALLARKAEERKVVMDKELQSMQPLSSKKTNDEIFAKLGSDKDKRKDADKEEKAKKSVSINEFLKPAEGERFYPSGGRGRGGRGRGSRGGFGGPNPTRSAPAPKIADAGEFPSLAGGK